MRCLKKPVRLFLFALMPLVSVSAAVKSDTLMMPDVNAQPPNSSEGVARPVRGISMDDVQAQFGKPQKIDGPVGKPPITRWSYAAFTVVFEGNTVIDSFVAK